jgi:hypothetical protein
LRRRFGSWTKLHHAPDGTSKWFCGNSIQISTFSGTLHRPDDDHTKTIFDKAIQGHTDQYMLKFEKP